jgi:signal recognition particle receptor subunit beta
MMPEAPSEAPQEHKILFTGTMGAGKTTAIAAVSGIKMVKTEAANTDRALFNKATTTVGFDYGEVSLDGGHVLRLYGTPGQQRFSFLWKIVAKGAIGVIILVDNSRPDPFEDLAVYLDSFRQFVDIGGVVIAVGRTESHQRPSIDDYYQYLAEQDLMLPVFAVDVRKSADVLMVLDVLFNMLEVSDAEPV